MTFCDFPSYSRKLINVNQHNVQVKMHHCLVWCLDRSGWLYCTGAFYFHLTISFFVQFPAVDFTTKEGRVWSKCWWREMHPKHCLESIRTVIMTWVTFKGFCCSGSLVFVWMELESELPVGFFELLVSSFFVHSENFIIILTALYSARHGTETSRHGFKHPPFLNVCESVQNQTKLLILRKTDVQKNWNVIN